MRWRYQFTFFGQNEPNAEKFVYSDIGQINGLLFDE